MLMNSSHINKTVSLSCEISHALLNNTSSIFNQTVQQKKQQLPIDIFHSEHLAVQQGREHKRKKCALERGNDSGS